MSDELVDPNVIKQDILLYFYDKCLYKLLGTIKLYKQRWMVAISGIQN